jgi:hypothetical protein
VAAAIAQEPLTAFEVVPRIYDEELATHAGPWLLTETLAMLTHLAASGRAGRDGREPERWSASQHANA